MKKAFYLLTVLFLCGGTIFTSCSSEDINQHEQSTNELILKSSLNIKSYVCLSKNIEEYFQQTRNTNELLTEKEAQELLAPAIEDGQKIKDGILNIIDKNSTEYQEYLSLTDEELIILSMMAVSNEPYSQTRAVTCISGNVILNCVGSALGIPSGIQGLSVSGLISAKTGLQVLKAIAKRYVFGYLALAISVYQFGDCINDIAKAV